MNNLDSFRNNSKYWIANMYSTPNILLRIQYTHHKLREWSRTPKRVKTLRKIMWHAYRTQDYTTAHMMFKLLSKKNIQRRKDTQRFKIIQSHFENNNHAYHVLNHRDENTIPSIYVMLQSETENRGLYHISKALCLWFYHFKEQHNHLKAFQISQLDYTLPQHFVNPLIYNNYKEVQLNKSGATKQKQSIPIETYPRIENLL